MINNTEDFRDLFKKSKSKDFASNVEEQAESQLMQSWDNFFSVDERDLLQQKRKDQDYLDIVWQAINGKEDLDQLLMNL